MFIFKVGGFHLLAAEIGVYMSKVYLSRLERLAREEILSVEVGIVVVSSFGRSTFSIVVPGLTRSVSKMRYPLCLDL